ncbi:hypothetical protein [Streptomyces sp. NPDC005435]|uniref:hypothetical protein n=1 Tax=Streptomyces sp. NPDC005435 TaxID=3154464 RepID=UPI003455D99E
MEKLADALPGIVAFALVAGMFTLVFTVSHRGRKKEREIGRGYTQLARNAAEHGWTYEAFTRGRIDHYSGIRPFPTRGVNMSACHYTTGEFRGRPFKYFEYRFMSITSGTDDNPQPLIRSVFVVEAPGSGAFMQIFRRGMLTTLFGRKPTMPLGKPAFDKEFRVITSDEEFTRKAFSRDLMPYLLTEPLADKTPLQFHEGELFTWYSDPLTPQAVDEKLNHLCDVLDRIPVQAWETS